MSATIVFLDMDGVMNNHKALTLATREENRIFPPGNLHNLTVDPDCVSLLRTWVESEDAKIVLSTSWRSWSHDVGGYDLTDIDQVHPRQKGNFFVANALRWAGWDDISNRIIGNTPSLPDACRGEEIQQWLQANPSTHYLILDDCPDMLEEQKKHHFIRTNPKLGLQTLDIELMTEKLKQLKQRQRLKI